MQTQTPSAPPTAPRLLIVAHAFAPASPIGTMRTLRLVRCLDAEGWRATVLMATPSTYLPSMPQDPALLARVPSAINLLHAPVWRPLERLAERRPKRAGRELARQGPADPDLSRHDRPVSLKRRIVARVDELTSIPDREVGWVLPAVVKGLRAIRRERPTAIYSTAPPWSGQLVAYALARLTGLPWVADFRDPWARAPWREKQPPRIRQAAVHLEAKVVERADAVLFATRGNRDEYASYYGGATAAKFHVIPNGCDPHEFLGLSDAVASDRFVLVHAGSIYGNRNPVPLFEAIASVIGKGLVRRDGFRLRLIGTAIVDGHLRAASDRLGLTDVVEFVPRMARRAILQEMASASGLLILQQGTTVSVPGKLFEYFALGKPMMAFCEEGETADLVRASGVGIAVTSAEPGAAEAGLLALLELARGPVARPPEALYDGNRFAAQALAVIAAVSRTRPSAGACLDSTDTTALGAEEASEWRG